MRAQAGSDPMTDSDAHEPSSNIGPCCPDGEPLPDWAVECLSRLFSSLGDPTRLTILRTLAEADNGRCVTDLSAHTGLSMSAISHQLRLLRDRGLVASRRKGRSVLYTLADDHVRTLIAIGLQHAQEDCPNRPKS